MDGRRYLPILIAALSLSGSLLLADELNEPRYTEPFAAPGIPGEWVGPRIETDQIVVKLAAGAITNDVEMPQLELPRGLEPLDTLLEKHGITEGRRALRERGMPIRDLELFERIGLDRIYEIDIPDPSDETRVQELVRDFLRQPWVEYAEPVYIHELTATPNDTSFPLQWSHRNTGQNVNGTSGSPDADADTDLAWDTNSGTSAAIVAILDTGVDLDHPDLIDNITVGYDYINDDPLANDVSGHGTGSAGIAAARGNNGIGVAGVCWECLIMPLKVSSSVHEANAMMFAADGGADTYNMSHTFGAAWIQIIIDATEYATALGALGFASATNFNGYNIGTPAAYPEVVPVGGSDQFDVRLYSYSDVTDITGPAPNTMSTGLGGGYIFFGGTSSSSPFGAGIGALLRSEDPDLHVREMRHVIRLGCDDEVGAAAEDTPGWDQFMGYGRVNADRSMDLLSGPWLALNRSHYVCAGNLTVALKDFAAGASVDVTLVGAVGGDIETVTVTPVPDAVAYYEGTIPISWAGRDGPVVIGDGKLDMIHDENIHATAGALSATAFMQCMKKVCQWENLGVDTAGDCDGDGAIDPGEIWQVTPPVVSFQTEEMFGVTARLETTNPDVIILKEVADIGDVVPFLGILGTIGNGVRITVAPGAAVNQFADFEFKIAGEGWDADQERCLAEQGWETGFSAPLHRDLGPVVQSFDFDDGTSQNFATYEAHNSGDLSQCSGVWVEEWNDLPVTDRAHSGTHSMRLGTGSSYSASNDAALQSPTLSVPAGGGAISFYMWQDGFIDSDFRTWDGLIVEATAGGGFSYLADGTYQSKQIQSVCSINSTKVPFGYAELVPMLAGDGTGTVEGGDVFDLQHQMSLDDYAGQNIRVRFRFGSHDFVDPSTHGEGTWIDTIALHGPWIADAWPGTGPETLQGSDRNCDASFDLSWSAVSGASSYDIFRSEISCADAVASLDPYASTLLTSYSDAGAVPLTQYYYAVGANDATSGCPSVRNCISGGCVACATPPDPADLTVGRDDDDVLMTWFGSLPVGPTWNVYRDPDKNPANWGAPLATGVTDEDPGTPGIQFTDVGGTSVGSLQFYLVTEVTCTESPLTE